MGNNVAPGRTRTSRDFKDGDGSLGILEGHMSGIKYDGTQMYRYWMRDDVQGEASFALQVPRLFYWIIHNIQR